MQIKEEKIGSFGSLGIDTGGGEGEEANSVVTPGAPESPDLSALALLGLDAMGDNLGTKEKCFAGLFLVARSLALEGLLP